MNGVQNVKRCDRGCRQNAPSRFLHVLELVHANFILYSSLIEPLKYYYYHYYYADFEFVCSPKFIFTVDGKLNNEEI